MFYFSFLYAMTPRYGAPDVWMDGFRLPHLQLAKRVLRPHVVTLVLGYFFKRFSILNHGVMPLTA